MTIGAYPIEAAVLPPVLRWTTDPRRFADYVRQVRYTRAGPLLYVYVNLEAKRLPCPLSPQVSDGALEFEFFPHDPSSGFVWPEDRPWPDAPEIVRLRVELGGEDGACVLSDFDRREAFALVVLGPRDGLVGESAATGPVDAAPDRRVVAHLRGQDGAS